MNRKARRTAAAMAKNSSGQQSPAPPADDAPPPDDAGPQPGMMAGQDQADDGSGQSDQGGMDQSDQPGQQDQGQDPEGEQATPEEQQQYDEFVTNCFNVIYIQQGKGYAPNPSIVKSLKNEHDPVMALAHTSAAVVRGVVENAKQKGVDLNYGVLLHGGAEILDDLATLAGKLNIHEYTDKEKEAASYQAIDMYRKMQPPQEQDSQEAATDFKRAIDADKAGNLNSVVPGASQAADSIVTDLKSATKGKPSPGGELQ